MKIFCDEKICVRCLACVSECEFGGVTFDGERLIFDETRPEDWRSIIEICPVAAIKIFLGTRDGKMQLGISNS